MPATKTGRLKKALFVVLLSGLTVLFFLGFRGTQDPGQVANSLGIQIPPGAEAISGSIQGFQSHRYNLEFRLPSSALPTFLADVGARKQDTTRFEGASPLLRGLELRPDTQVMDWTSGQIRGIIQIDLLDNRQVQVRVVASN